MESDQKDVFPPSRNSYFPKPDPPGKLSGFLLGQIMREGPNQFRKIRITGAIPSRRKDTNQLSLLCEMGTIQIQHSESFTSKVNIRSVI